MRDEGWVDRAKCREVDPAQRDALFFPHPGDNLELAKAICAMCSVRSQCLEFALSTGEHHGIWGGKSAKERMRIARARRRGLPDPVERRRGRNPEFDAERSATVSEIRRANAAAVAARLNR